MNKFSTIVNIGKNFDFTVDSRLAFQLPCQSVNQVRRFNFQSLHSLFSGINI